MSYGVERGYYNSENDPTYEQIPKRAKRFDDDFRGLPTMSSSYQELEDIHLFTTKGGRVVTDLYEQAPELDLVLKRIQFSPDTNIVDLNCKSGFLGVSLARLHPQTNFLLIDSNLHNIEITQRNIGANHLSNVRVEAVAGIEDLIDRNYRPDTVIYEVIGFAGNKLIDNQFGVIKNLLSVNQLLLVISHKKSGANRQVDSLSEIFGADNVEVIAKGRGGYRIISAIKRDENSSEVMPTSLPVNFELNGCTYRLESDTSLFSTEGLDQGTRLLLETVDVTKSQKILDVGCGWGPMGIVAAVQNPSARVTMVDIDLRAIRAAQKNVLALDLEDRVKVIPTTNPQQLNEKFDLVLSNPPFHQEYGVLLDLLKNVRTTLAKNGEIYLVIERSYVEKFSHLLEDTFGHYKSVANNARYFVLSSRK